MRRRSQALLAALVLSAVAACGPPPGPARTATTATNSQAGSPYGFAPAPQKDGKLVVWVDSTRLDAAKAYQAAHPDVQLDIVTYDGNANGSGTLKTKVQLFNRAGEGWPDVVFTTDNNTASWASQGDDAFVAPLSKGLVDQATLDGFAKGALDVCTVGGVVYCLRNDLAQVVLWYDKKLFDEFGYTVPKTWEEYQALAGKVAAEHPGYLVGTAGDAWAPEIYMWGAQCPANQVTGAKAITVKATDPACVRAARMIDKLVANKTMSMLPLFGPDFAKNQGDKVLMLPGPAWYGGAVFQGALKTPKGRLAVGDALHWADQNPPVTGNVGGGTWWLSRHTARLDAAKDFLTWVATADAYQVDKSPGYPAYASAAAKWIAKQQDSGYYAGDIAAPITAAAGQVWPGWGSPEFSQESIWAKTVIPGQTAGKTVESLLPEWQTAIERQAQVFGYQVAR
ncbi:extracellular solute-binding protein [Actinomadura sp. ATCC 31491]|uniref:Extracellular solute-binding protein n=1 Tax=Actinomadura luzonensis TaxID=2805427 RepID=A0ABT0G6K4_9ACTN|nr:extracellular solute-binding protein [Actinomadura luzonensis]MCK2220242.1 extracellular solute-binding protein [Actinomadura luzonensis]